MIKANNREYSLITRGLRPDPIDWTDMLTEEEKKALNLKEPTPKKKKPDFAARSFKDLNNARPDPSLIIKDSKPLIKMTAPPKDINYNEQNSDSLSASKSSFDDITEQEIDELEKQHNYILKEISQLRLQKSSLEADISKFKNKNSKQYIQYQSMIQIIDDKISKLIK